MSKDVLIAEYNQLFSEIREVNNKVTIIVKYYVGLFTSLLAYIFIGIKFYVDKSDKLIYPFFIMYSIIGCVLTITLYFIGHIASRQYAVSKKHRVRYWKAIHAIRKAFTDKYPSLIHCLVLPKNSNRPNVSSGEYVTPYLFAILNILFACMIYWFILILFATDINNNKLDFGINNLINSFSIFFGFLIILLLLLPANCAYYSKQFYLARKLSFKKLYINYPETVKYKLLDTWKRHYLKKYQSVLVLTIVVLYFIILFINKIITVNDALMIKIKIIGWIIIFLMILYNGLIYLYPYFTPKWICRYCKSIMPNFKKLHDSKCMVRIRCPNKSLQ